MITMLLSIVLIAGLLDICQCVTSHEDVDECAGERGRDYDPNCHTCINTIGNYTCSCKDGFELDLTTNQTCIAMATSTSNIPLALVAGVVSVLVLLIVAAIIAIFLTVRQRRKEDAFNDSSSTTPPDVESLSDVGYEEVPGLEDHDHDTRENRNALHSELPHDDRISDIVYEELPGAEDLTHDTRQRAEADSSSYASIALPDRDSLSDIVYYEEMTDTIYGNTSEDHFIALDNLKQFVPEIGSGMTILKEEFKAIPRRTAKSTYAENSALLPQQRIADVLPYDHNRVQLKKLQGQPHSDYINASIVEGVGGRKYIATQGPKAETVDDFWRMVWEQDVQRIIMMTKLVENEVEKCCQYWPKQNQMESGEFTIKLCTVSIDQYFSFRRMELSKVGPQSGTRQVIQYQLTAWPDNRAPSSITGFLKFFWEATQGAQTKGPIIVHCNAGIGKTGILIAMDHLLEQATTENGVDIFACVKSLRESRMHTIQSLDQYNFLHWAIFQAHVTGSTSYLEPQETQKTQNPML